MNTYDITVAYRTKREGVAMHMIVKAESEDAATEYAEQKMLKGYPARKLVYTQCSLLDGGVAHLETGAERSVRTGA